MLRVARRHLTSFWLGLGLALSMLLMQQAGLRHSLEHALGGEDKQLVHTTLCKDCLLYAAANAVPHSAPTWQPPAHQTEQFDSITPISRALPLEVAYSPRAPPVTTAVRQRAQA